MTKKSLTLYSLLLAALFFIHTLPSSVMSGDRSDTEWSYSIEKGIEKSKRSYLLVYAPKEKKERRIKVISECQKPHSAEGAYGKCTHKIDIQPTNKKITLKTGEDVVMIFFPWGPLVLGTINYGCCGGPDIVYFYTENGKYLGSLEGFNLSNRANYNNLIAREFDMKNTTGIYMLVEKGDKIGDIQALVFENGDAFKRIPVLFTIKGKEKCEYWHIEEFVKYGDREYITLKMNGYFCKGEALEEQVFICSNTEKGISCSPINNKEKREITDQKKSRE